MVLLTAATMLMHLSGVLAIASASHTMHLSGSMGADTVSMQFQFSEDGGQFVMEECTKETCRFEITKPKGSDEQGSFTGELTALMPNMFDLNLKSDDESLAFQGIFSSEYGGYEFDGQMVHGTDVQELKMSQTFDNDIAKAAEPGKKHHGHHMHSGMDDGDEEAVQVPVQGSYVANPITGHFDIAVPVHTDGTPAPATPAADAQTAPVAVSTDVLPEDSTAEVIPVVIAQQDGPAEKNDEIVNNSPFSRIEPIIFGISGGVCFIGAVVLLAIGLRRRRFAGASLRPNDDTSSDHWANPKFTPASGDLVANISVL